MPHLMSLAPGTRLGPDEVLAALGAGGMGEVYKARDSRLDRLVAVKVLSPALAVSSDARERFEREARAISRLSHPHVCALFDVGREGDTSYLVMELLDGATLTTLVAQGPLPMSEVYRIGTAVAEALAAAARAGIVHRDLKPGNVMVTRSGVKLLDFGLAKTLAGRTVGAEALSTALELTGPGMSLGTAPYMAPEQCEGRPTSAATSSRSVPCSMRWPPGGGHFRPDVPAWFDRLVLTCLANMAPLGERTEVPAP